MVISHLRILFFAFIPMFFLAESGFSQAVPNLSQWTKEALSSLERPGAVTFPRKVLLISGWKDEFYPQLSGFKIKGGILQSVSEREMEWSYGLNFFPGGKKPNELSLQKRTVQSMLVTGSNTAIIFPTGKSKKWRVVYRNGSRVTFNQKKRGHSSVSKNTVKMWLRKIFGYDAVVLGVKGDFLLVGRLLHGFNGVALQGLVAADSDSRARVKGAIGQGVGLISYVSGRGQFAIFRIVFKEKGISSIPLGSKVVLEKVSG
jgi:hypothetical protein